MTNADEPTITDTAYLLRALAVIYFLVTMLVIASVIV